MRRGVKSISAPPPRGLIVGALAIMLVVAAMLPVVPARAAEDPDAGTFLEMKPVSTPYWMRCGSGEAVVQGNLTPAPLDSNDRTAEVIATGPTVPKITLTNVAVFSINFDDLFYDFPGFQLHGFDMACIWVKSNEDVKDADFRVNLQRSGETIATMQMDIQDLDGTPRELKATDAVDFRNPYYFNYYDTLEVQVQYTAASRSIGGPAPDSILLAGSTAYPSRVKLSVIPMNIEVTGGLADEKDMYVFGEIIDTSGLDPEEDLEYDLSIYDPRGEQVNPATVDLKWVYVDYWDEVTVSWTWSYSLMDNENGSYRFQVAVSYGSPGVSYSNSTSWVLYFNETGSVFGDSDGDGHPDNEDEFPRDPEEWADSDDDGVGDNTDAFPLDANETKDTDGDGHGDNGDEFPLDTTEWADTDGDGHGDNCDCFPFDGTEWRDSDGDGWGDNCDCFPLDGTEWKDSDGDGVGDNSDAYPNDPDEWLDSDGDGHGDKDDAFPDDPDEWVDTDGDGHGDNGDEFPGDASEWRDSDGDGRGDNGDAFPLDVEEWQDSDGDDHGDNGDEFPNDVSEWADTDGDGVGDNGDDFPEDAAASVDSDGDSHPDRWNTGRSERDSTTGLTLDHHPDDPDRWEEGSSLVGGGDLPLDTTTLIMMLAIVALVVILVLTVRRRDEGT